MRRNILVPVVAIVAITIFAIILRCVSISRQPKAQMTPGLLVLLLVFLFSHTDTYSVAVNFQTGNLPHNCLPISALPARVLFATDGAGIQILDPLTFEVHTFINATKRVYAL